VALWILLRCALPRGAGGRQPRAGASASVPLHWAQRPAADVSSSSEQSQPDGAPPPWLRGDDKEEKDREFWMRSDHRREAEAFNEARAAEGRRHKEEVLRGSGFRLRTHAGSLPPPPLLVLSGHAASLTPY